MSIIHSYNLGKGIKDQDRNIQSNQVLLKEFMENALAKLSRTGQIHITLKTGTNTTNAT